MRLIISIALLAVAYASVASAAVAVPAPEPTPVPEGDVPSAAKVVRAEALRPNQGLDFRPLPLVAHWHRLTLPPAFQVEMIRQGHPVLPWISYHRGLKPERVVEQYGEAIGTLRAWNLPIVLLTGGQWEADFYHSDEYKDVPPEQSGATLGLDGKLLKSVSPFSPVEPWRELGGKWTNNPGCRKLQELYPDPPLVFFLTNNEAHDLRWSQVEQSKRYMDQYGAGRSDEFKRKVVAEGWAERYGALIEGMKAGLDNDTWRKNCRIIAYNGFRQPWWDGAVPEAYDNHWQPAKKAFYVYSCQTEMMNLRFMKPRILQRNPDFWVEVIFWDGDGGKAVQYEKLGIAYTPELYGGWAQYCLWTVTPRVAREWRGSSYRRDAGWWPYFATIIRAVDLVHKDPVLRRFWRKGELVVNRGVANPVTHGIPESLQQQDRWYHLPTSLDPPPPWELDTRLPVYTLARVIGESPRREWLLYAHAPIGKDQKNVEVTIPGYKPVTLDVRVAGSFYHLRESDGSVTAVGDPQQVVFASNGPPTARDDAYAVAGGESLKTTIFRFSGIPGVLRNDVDEEGDPLTAQLVEGPRHGKLEFREDGSFTYVPAKDFHGADAFTYRARDLTQASKPATVTLRVTEGLARVVDDGEAGFEDTSQWVTTDTVGGFGGDMAFYPAGPGGGTTATWTFADLPGGEYEVFVTWPLFSYQRPKRVPLEILDGTTSRAKASVNQDAEPKGQVQDGRPWQSLGKVKITSGTLKVVLSNAAQGRWVVADAVRVVPSAGGQARTIDNGDAGYAEQASWLVTDRGFGGSSRYLRGTKDKQREATASWMFADLQPGVYEVFATWPPGSSRMTVGYTVFDGEQTKAQVRINQARQPRDLLARDATWASLGEFVVANGSLKVVLSNLGAKSNVMADAVALSPRGQQVGTILDEADEGFDAAVQGGKIGHSFRGQGLRFNAKQTKEAPVVATWKLDALPAGRYRVMATWLGNRAHRPKVTYHVVEGDAELAAGVVDQTQQPVGRRFEGAAWQEIGVIKAGGGPVEVRLVPDPKADGHVVADAVWFVPLGPAK